MDPHTISQNNPWQLKIAKNITGSVDLSTDSAQPYIALINSQSVLEIKGPDAVKFLQGQCSADVASLEEQHCLAGSICTVKGRVLCTFIATGVDERILLKMSAELVVPMREYLSKYAAFFKVELIAWPTPCVIETPQPKNFETATIPLKYHLGEKEFTEHLIEPNNLVSMAEELNSSGDVLVTEESWGNRQIDSGWLNLTLDTSEKYLPHQLNLERLNAISFTKGCYTGQEIIARTEYRGKPKRRMHLVELQGLTVESLSLPIECIDSTSDKTLGILLSVSSDRKKALAILPVDHQGTSLAKLEGNEFSITMLEQPYTTEKS